MFYVHFSPMFVRMIYYCMWLLIDGACIASGLAYNGEDSNGKPKWDRILSIDILKLETSTSTKDQLMVSPVTSLFAALEPPDSSVA